MTADVEMEVQAPSSSVPSATVPSTLQRANPSQKEITLFEFPTVYSPVSVIIDVDLVQI